MQDIVSAATAYDALGADLGYSLPAAMVLASYTYVLQGEVYDGFASVASMFNGTSIATVADAIEDLRKVRMQAMAAVSSCFQ